MVFYIGVAIFIVISSYFLSFFCVHQKRKNFQAIWGGILLIVIAACRSVTVGVDTPQYVQAYKYIAQLNWIQVIKGTGLGSFEIGYRILMKLFTLVSVSEHFFLLWTSFMAIIPTVIFIKRYSNVPILSYVIYILSGQYFMQIGVVRQSIAFGIALWAIMIVMERKEKWLVKSVMLVLLATSIHTAAFIAIGAILIAKIENVDAKYYLVVASSTMILVIFGPKILGQILAHYGQYSGYANQEGGIGRIVIVLAIMLFVLLYKKLLYSNDTFGIWWEKFISITFMLKVFSYFFIAASRAAALFEIGYVTVIPNTVVSIKQRDKIIWITIIIGLFSYLFYTGYDVRNNFVFWA